ncbi:MAG TPA: hotdog domain-containing protein [Burkholderiales bacterium]|nr:hotdog domain-containing protein [Burkholderiales bacterium]
MFTMLNVGDTGSATLRVSEADLATTLSQHKSDAFPPVFATARMIGLMELAAARAMHAILNEGELSVGVSINVSHNAATPIGIEVTATARFTGREEKLYVFEVYAADAGGEIGRGVHRRAVVSTTRIVQGAARRNAI